MLISRPTMHSRKVELFCWTISTT